MTFTRLESVREEVRELAELFDDAGHRLYLVGGIVRDQWLDLPLGGEADVDLTTDAEPHRVKEIVQPVASALWTQGERFGTIGLRVGKRTVEITTHRGEEYEPGSRKPRVAYSTDIEADLSRRDFTVNAMALDVLDGSLIDPFGGAADLASRVLRTPLGAEQSFTDDPLRVLRAARFATKYELEIVPEVVAAAITHAERLDVVAIERIGDEIERLLALPDPSPGLQFLAETGVLARVIWHRQRPPDVQAETVAQAIEWVALMGSVSPHWLHRLTALLVGLVESTDEVTRACTRLRLSTDERREVVALARDSEGVLAALNKAGDDLDNDEFGLAAPSDELLRRWWVSTTNPTMALGLARVRAGTDRPDDVAVFERALADLAERENLDDLAPLLDGAAVMELLSLPTGPLVGEAVKHLQNERFARGPIPIDEERAVLHRWWSDRPS